jgi:hypothetical protein
VNISATELPGLSAAGAADAADAAECKLRKIADLPVTMEGLRPMVTAQIDGAEHAPRRYQNALRITPPSTRSAAPVVAEASGLAM